MSIVTRGVFARMVSREAAGALVAGVVPPGFDGATLGVAGALAPGVVALGADGAPACWLVCVAGSGAWLFGARKYWKPNKITQETTIARMRFF